MRKFLGLVALVVAAALVAAPVYAEVQNVKVSGDVNVKAITHHDFDLKQKQGNLGIPPRQQGVVSNDDEGDIILQTTRVRVDADLTDNVSAAVRLLNQRFWDGQNDGDGNEIVLDNAYVTLKELVYSPLTVTVGRQPLMFGTGFIVGQTALLADPQGVFAGTAGAAGAASTAGGIAREFSANNAYDAIKATLDFSPLVATGIWAKINETGVTTNDQTLYGINLNWKGTPVDRVNGEAELYWFFKDDQGFSGNALGGALHDNTRAWDENRVHTVGGRVAGDPLENLHLNGEFAYQFGELEDGDTPVVGGAGTLGQGFLSRDREAWALNLSAHYTWVNAPWTPTTGLGYVHYTGEESGGIGQSDDFDSWDGMFRGQYFTAIQEFLAGTDSPNFYATVDAADTAANTNRQLLYGDLIVKPLQDLTTKLRFTHIWFDETPVAGRDDDAGDELDVQALYDYTEDVQFGLLGAWFFPGDYYDGAPSGPARGDATAWELVGDVTVKF